VWGSLSIKNYRHPLLTLHILCKMASSPPPGIRPSPAISNPIDLLHTDSIPLHRRAFASVPSQSKPVYPSYHLEPTTPLPHRPRSSDAFKPLNILRSSLRPPILRLPFHLTPTPAPVEKPVGVVERRRPTEEFIAVVFGNEVWMGLVDLKSDKPIVSPDEQIQEEFGITRRSEIGGLTTKLAEMQRGIPLSWSPAHFAPLGLSLRQRAQRVPSTKKTNPTSTERSNSTYPATLVVRPCRPDRPPIIRQRRCQDTGIPPHRAWSGGTIGERIHGSPPRGKGFT
jgi:hypothetical protein